MDAGGSGTDALLGQEEDEEAMNAMAAASTANAMAVAVAVAREYRRGNWTLPETMLLIEAKKRVHDGRRPAADQGLARWRWVEDYCWRRGCRRSQNQCNDRWDNLMRDYKKVRAQELAAGGGGGGLESYWVMGRAERKERGLPANLLREIYDAMGEVVERRMSSGGGGAVFLAGASSSGSGGLADVPAMAMQASPLAQLLPRPLETTANCSSGSPERKRRRPSLDNQPPWGSITTSTPPATGRQGHQEHHHDDDEYAHHGADGSSDDDDDGLGGAIGRCAAILSVALENREASEERRHREVIAAEERRGRARQARREAGEQCMAGLAAAVSQLAGSMLALAAKRRGPADPK
uniref:Myb-like domain-containing protein n=1 Tax=Oryza punctata TaxID=4537 RepID=A0A0E0KH66_ORYPU